MPIGYAQIVYFHEVDVPQPFASTKTGEEFIKITEISGADKHGREMLFDDHDLVYIGFTPSGVLF